MIEANLQIEERGRPEGVRSDNGPEFCWRRMLAWAEERKVELVHIQPGRPMPNGHVESFHGRLHDECLNVNWFRTFNKAAHNYRQTVQYCSHCGRPSSEMKVAKDRLKRRFQ